MQNQKYIELIRAAVYIVRECDLHPSFQPIAFEVVLKHMLENSEEDIDMQVESRIESYREQGRRED